MKAVELFAGAGGLAMGVRLAGFSSVALVEWDKSACNTIRLNQSRGFPLLADAPAPFEGDVRAFDWASLDEDIDLVAGGPPCQPFSMGGRHRANDDLRDMFPSTVKIIKALRPKAFILENVKGLTRASFANYFQYILLQLEFPEVATRNGETSESHFDRLQREKTSGALHLSGLTYNVLPTLVNAADYGIPQKRERVFMVGFRSDLGVEWSFPAPTHSEDALLHAQWISGSYWDRHKVLVKQRLPLPGAKSQALANRVERMRSSLFPPVARPWKTVRDALAGLPDAKSSAAADVADHTYQPGAKVYPGHTGSPLDQPAKTIKAGDHGVPGGENMMVLPGGSVRYFSVRETARIQTFPDGFVFNASWTESMRQLGNAVPVMLARVVASSVATQLLHAQGRRIDLLNESHKQPERVAA
jgi:DNA (cytosine-5)-methyltransferase 1